MLLSVSQSTSLYSRLLGEAFDALPLSLRQFHASATGGIAVGSLRVSRGKGVLRQALALLMRLPTPGDAVLVRLEVAVSGAEEGWYRTFGTSRLVTRQWAQNGLLRESAGPICFGFRLTADATGMQFHFVRCWLLGVPLPRAVGPCVTATARGVDTGKEGWWLQVQVDVPMLGTITQYEGWMRSV